MVAEPFHTTSSIAFESLVRDKKLLLVMHWRRLGGINKAILIVHVKSLKILVLFNTNDGITICLPTHQLK